MIIYKKLLQQYEHMASKGESQQNITQVRSYLVKQWEVSHKTPSSASDWLELLALGLLCLGMRSGAGGAGHAFATLQKNKYSSRSASDWLTLIFLHQPTKATNQSQSQAGLAKKSFEVHDNITKS